MTLQGGAGAAAAWQYRLRTELAALAQRYQDIEAERHELQRMLHEREREQHKVRLRAEYMAGQWEQYRATKHAADLAQPQDSGDAATPLSLTGGAGVLDAAAGLATVPAGTAAERMCSVPKQYQQSGSPCPDFVLQRGHSVAVRVYRRNNGCPSKGPFPTRGWICLQPVLPAVDSQPYAAIPRNECFCLTLALCHVTQVLTWWRKGQRVRFARHRSCSWMKRHAVLVSRIQQQRQERV